MQHFLAKVLMLSSLDLDVSRVSGKIPKPCILQGFLHSSLWSCFVFSRSVIMWWVISGRV